MVESFNGNDFNGFGIFNLVRHIDHHILGIHHVNETVTDAQWIYWDLGFSFGAVMLIGDGSCSKGRRTNAPESHSSRRRRQREPGLRLSKA
jgi:uncharacterized membrane protein